MRRTAPQGVHPLESRLFVGGAYPDEDERPDLGFDPAGALLFEKECEIDVLHGRILELELLIDETIPLILFGQEGTAHKQRLRSALDSSSAASMLRLWRLMMRVVDLADWSLRGQATRAELEAAIQQARAAFPNSRPDDHRA